MKIRLAHFRKKEWQKTERLIKEKVSQELSAAQEQIARQVSEEVSAEVSRRVERHIAKRMEEMLEKMQQGIQANSFLYGFLALVGLLLFWYGAWRVIPLIPLISEGPIALSIGIFLLMITGYKIIGPSK